MMTLPFAVAYLYAKATKQQSHAITQTVRQSMPDTPGVGCIECTRSWWRCAYITHWPYVVAIMHTFCSPQYTQGREQPSFAD